MLHEVTRRNTWLRARLPAVLLLLALIKGLVWTIALPPWYGPDEPAHFMYVQHLALEHRIPVYAPVRGDGRDVTAEVKCSTLNLGFHLNGPFFAESVFDRDPAACLALPRWTQYPEVPSNPAGAYFPLYYGAAVPFYELARDASVEVRLQAVRLLGVLMGLAATGLAYLACWWAFGGRRSLAIAGAAVFTFQPMASQTFAVVNNDGLLLLLSAAIFWRFFRALRRSPTSWEGVWMGILTGLAYLAKPQGIFLGALAMTLLPIRWRQTRKTVLFQYTSAFTVTALAFVLVGAAGNLVWHGQIVPQSPVAATVPHALNGYLSGLAENGFKRPYYLMIGSVWGYFGWLSPTLPSEVFNVIILVYIATAVGTLIALYRRQHDRTVLIAALGSLLLFVGLLLGLEAIYYSASGKLILQGRSFLEAFPAAMILLVGGITALGPRSCENVLAAGVAAGAVALNLLSLMLLLETFFG